MNCRNIYCETRCIASGLVAEHTWAVGLASAESSLVMILYLTVKSERRLKREQSTVVKMITLFCRGNHGSKGSSLCYECEELNRYVVARLERCPFGDDKPVCDRCLIHCYRTDLREQIKRVMRYSGPRMFLRHPVLTAFHFIDAHRAAPEAERSKV